MKTTTITSTRFTRAAIRATFTALPLCAALGVATLAAAQDYAPPPPPPTYVATVDPVYYNGQPTYWYGNHWYWRDGNGNWQYYREEPGFLHDHRMHGPPDRHIDERRGDAHRGGRR